ncbi:MAG: GuaB3 family IMP dehydrogenase-related protein [Dehalococcoidia bacterium]|nr:GuaB3 family IMP dehydrogenase-related protein [Dehalococcoidia bacterium]MDD5648099.1 GuaB3 family IMP dehydrogenase-related protein [Dehalococcoidia bacterium]
MPIPKFKELERAYGFDEVAIVPGDVTVNPDQTNIEFKIRDITFAIPIVAAAMDAVVDPDFAIILNKAGGLPILNLDGVQVRYDNPRAILDEIINAPQGEVTALMQKIYSQPIKDSLIAQRIQKIKKAGAVCAVSMIPATTKKLAPLAEEAGADIIVVQTTVTTARHISKSYRGLSFSDLCKQLRIPVVVGNAVTYSAALELMRTGIDGLLVGIGPGAACTTREVLGVGVPQVTATIDCAAARDVYFKETGRYVSIITDGGIRIGSDMCKAFVSGADAVVFGSILTRAGEAPGKGYHWGMSQPSATLPRGTRIKTGVKGSLEKLLFGPSHVTDGTENYVGALRNAMGVCGALNIKEFQKVKLVIAPSIKTEGKYFQAIQQSC